MTGSARELNPTYMATHHASVGGHSGIMTRSERVAQRSAGQGFFANANVYLKRDHWGKFIVLTFFTSIALSCVIGAWNPPFRYRIHSVVDRAIICNAPFSVFSLEQTRLEKDRARMMAPRVFVNDPQPLIQLRETLARNTITELVKASTYDELDEQSKQTWIKLFDMGEQEDSPGDSEVQAAFDDFVSYFKDESNFNIFQAQMSRATEYFENHGVLIQSPVGPEQHILIYRKHVDTPEQAIEYRASAVLLLDGAALRGALRRELGDQRLGNFLLCDLVFHWVYPDKIPATLTEDLHATALVAEEAVEKVEDIKIEYAQGQHLVNAGTVLQEGDINLLLKEYKASLEHRTKAAQFSRFVAVVNVFFLVLVVMISLILRLERRRPHTTQAFFNLMLGIIGTVVIAQCILPSVAAYADWELFPLLLFGMLIAVIYSWELATVLSAFLAIVLISGSGGNVELFVILLVSSIAMAVQLGRLRSREKLVIVGTITGGTAFFLTIVLGMQGNRLLDGQLCTDAAINFVWAFLAGLVMTGILPFVEKQFGILTDMSLRELGDVSHPLIQRLIRAAPATYEHCTQVGSIAEAAADAIKARGLLTRVGAHFHDIGKIMKPEFFSENQGGISNVHDTLEPQLSTIVLIAHIKDGVDMARQYHFPKPLIDLIEQHHGTSLISFFYSRATKGGKEDVEESTFRYPGPKPQMKEAAILMIADTCESACRSMGTGVPPNKIEAKIRALIKQKMDDGQFDESGLTLKELKIIEKSVTNSIVAAMHGRIQYPETVTDKREHSDSGIHRLDESSVRWSAG